MYNVYIHINLFIVRLIKIFYGDVNSEKIVLLKMSNILVHLNQESVN